MGWLRYRTIATSAYTFIAIIWPLDSYVTSFIPVGTRPVLVAVLMVGTLLYFLSDEWLTRGQGAARGAYVVSKLALMASLAVAVALDPHRLFFLAIISPVILLFLVVYGLLSRWIYNSTGHPFAGGCFGTGFRLGDRGHISAARGLTFSLQHELPQAWLEILDWNAENVGVCSLDVILTSEPGSALRQIKSDRSS